MELTNDDVNLLCGFVFCGRYMCRYKGFFPVAEIFHCEVVFCLFCCFNSKLLRNGRNFRVTILDFNSNLQRLNPLSFGSSCVYE